jgi:hypothetical protein
MRELSLSRFLVGNSAVDFPVASVLADRRHYRKLDRIGSATAVPMDGNAHMTHLVLASTAAVAKAARRLPYRNQNLFMLPHNEQVHLRSCFRAGSGGWPAPQCAHTFMYPGLSDAGPPDVSNQSAQP